MRNEDILKNDGKPKKVYERIVKIISLLQDSLEGKELKLTKMEENGKEQKAEEEKEEEGEVVQQ